MDKSCRSLQCAPRTPAEPFCGERPVLGGGLDAMASRPATPLSSILTAAAVCGYTVWYLHRWRTADRRVAAIELGPTKAKMLVADVDYRGRTVVREVHSRELRRAPTRCASVVVRALVYEARDVGAVEATVFARGGATAREIEIVERRFRAASAADGADADAVSFARAAPPWLAPSAPPPRGPGDAPPRTPPPR